MSIKTKMQKLKRELLIEEASKMFEKYGYEQMKIADLAKVAHVSVGTIYTLFPSKEGLYLAYIEYQIKKFYAELKEKTALQDSAEKKIYTFIELKFLYFIQKQKAIIIGAAKNPLFFNAITHEQSEVFEKIYQFLHECFMQINPQIDKEKAKRLSYALNGFSDGYITLWLESNDELLEKVDEVCDFFIKILR